MAEQQPPQLIEEHKIRSDVREKYSHYVIMRLRFRSAPIIQSLREICRNEKKLPVQKVVKKLDELGTHLALDCFQDDKEIVVLIQTIHHLLKIVKKRKFLVYVHYFAACLRMDSKSYEKSLQDVCFQILNSKNNDETSLITKVYALRTLEKHVVQTNNLASQRKLLSWVMSCVDEFHRKRFGKSKLKKMLKIDQLKKNQRIFFSNVVEYIGRNIPQFVNDVEIFQRTMNYLYVLVRRKETFIARDAMFNIYRLIHEYVNKIPSPGTLSSKAFEPLIQGIPENMALDENSKQCILPPVVRENKNSAIMKTLNFHDEMTRVFFLRLAKYILSLKSLLNENKITKPKMQTTPKKQVVDASPPKKQSQGSSNFSNSQIKIIRFIRYLFHDPSTQVFVECVKLYSSYDPLVFECFLYRDIAYKNRNILSFVFQRLNYLLVDAYERREQALEFSIIQIIEILISKLTIFLIKKYSLTTILRLSKIPLPPATELGLSPQEKDKLVLFLVEMGRLLDKMEMYKTSQDTHLRYMAFRVSLWSRNIEQLGSEVGRLRNEIGRPNCPWHGFQILGILKALLDYCHVYPDVFLHFTDFCQFLLTRHLDLLEPSLPSLIGLFQRSFSVIPEIEYSFIKSEFSKMKEVMIRRGKQFLKMLMKVLEECSSNTFFYAMLIFLGEYANRISLHFGDSKKKLVKSENDENENKPKLSDVPKIPSDSPEFEKLEEFHNYEIRNSTMKTIIMLLFHSSIDNLPHIRLACVEGLLKIGIRSPGKVRFLSYNCLRFILRRNGLGMIGRCENVYQKCSNLKLIFDEIFSLKVELDLLFEKDILGEKISSDDSEKESEESKKKTRTLIRDFWFRHELLKEKLCCFHRCQDSFLPLGKSSRLILKKGFYINHEMREKNKKKKKKKMEKN